MSANSRTYLTVQAKVRVMSYVSQTQISDKLTVHRFAFIKNAPTGKKDGEGYAITKPHGILVDFKNISQEELYALTFSGKGALLEFPAEIMEQSFLVEGARVSYHTLECWGEVTLIQASRAYRYDENYVPLEPERVTNLSYQPVAKATAPVAQPAAYAQPGYDDDIPF